ncbi:hypothetical protein CABS01_16174 [Colletotrichum abscissum]|nr:uncharacterized protein CABS01_16174 [Colletotrichum abscissum]KAK1472788.1 hypothetical protein CABS01_16174 [Colletotrichum abscissum]
MFGSKVLSIAHPSWPPETTATYLKPPLPLDPPFGPQNPNRLTSHTD